MQASPISPEPLRVDLDASKVDFTAVLIYDDLETGKRGKEVCDRMLRAEPSEASERLSVWSRALLETDPGYHAAIEYARDAGVIILSLRSSTPMSSGLKRWLKACLQQHGTDAALLVACFTPSQAYPHSAAADRDWLETLAVQAGVDFLAHLPYQQSSSQ